MSTIKHHYRRQSSLGFTTSRTKEDVETGAVTSYTFFFLLLLGARAASSAGQTRGHVQPQLQPQAGTVCPISLDPFNIEITYFTLKKLIKDTKHN